MSQAEEVRQYLLKKLGPYNQPQIFSAQMIYHAINVKRPQMGGGTPDKIIGVLRRTGHLVERGCIGSEKYYSFSVVSRGALKACSYRKELLKGWTQP